MVDFSFVSSMTPRARNKVGLDIGASSVRLVEILDTPDHPRLVSCGMRPIAAGKETLSETVRSLVRELKVTPKDVAISVAGPSVIVRFVSMPRMSDEELRGALRFEAEKFIPFTISDCIVDFQILRKDPRENKFDLLLVAAKKDFIMDKIRLVEASGLSVATVDVDACAVSNAFHRAVPAGDGDKSVALIDIGAKYSNLNIVKGGIPYVLRDIPIGGNDFVHAGTPEKTGTAPAGGGEGKGALSSLVEEVRLSFTYYENQYGRAVTETYLSGGGSRAAGVEEALAEAMGTKPLRWNPFQFLDAAGATVEPAIMTEHQQSFAVAVGLALR